MSKFEAGKTYSTRSVCDHDCIIRVTVAKRTAKTITTDAGKVLRIGEYEGVEFVKPWGSYSMDRTTVYPSRAGGFPPASFFTLWDALGYIRTLQGYGLPCGICTCPAASYPMHYRDTL